MFNEFVNLELLNLVISQPLSDICSSSRLTNALNINRGWCKTNPLTPTVANYIKHPVPDRIKSSFVIFDIQAL